MPKNKNADLRIKVLDRCLSDKSRGYTTSELLELCNKELELNGFKAVTATNTIRDDIEQIERIYPGALVESVREGRNIYYHYEDPDFSIFNKPLKPDEIIQLTQTLMLLKRFKGMPQFDWINEMAERLGATLKIDEKSADEVVGFDENLDLKGLEHFTPLFNAIIDRRTLLLSYKSFKVNAEQKITVYPYYLKQYNKRWFLIAWNADLKFLANFALDRITKIKESKKPYQPSDIDFVDYFDEMIGVSKDTRTTPQKVKLWVSSETWPYIMTKPLHGTQKTISADSTGAVISIEVYLNYELEQLILSYGENVKVLEPAELKNKLQKRLADAYQNYQK